jgi:hypothetical protein
LEKVGNFPLPLIAHSLRCWQERTSVAAAEGTVAEAVSMVVDETTVEAQEARAVLPWMGQGVPTHPPRL